MVELDGGDLNSPRVSVVLPAADGGRRSRAPFRTEMLFLKV